VITSSTKRLPENRPCFRTQNSLVDQLDQVEVVVWVI